MNIEQAKAIPISEILAKFEIYPSKENATDAMYLSPFRNERTPSFHVDKQTNEWFDHGDGERSGGNAFTLVLKILDFQGYRSTPSDGYRWIKNTNLAPGQIKPRDRVHGKKSKWKVLNVLPLRNRALILYLKKRGINVELAKHYVSEIDVCHRDNITKIWALGFKNEDGGYELRNQLLKSAVSPKTITFIRADEPKPDGVMVFEGFMDFLSYLTIKKGKLGRDIIVLNSVACVDHAYRYIKNYGYKTVYTWFDNDNAGNKAKDRLSEFLKSETDLVHKPMNNIYRDHVDFNAWHMNVLGLKPLN